jgi:hypothetical protein
MNYLQISLVIPLPTTDRLEERIDRGTLVDARTSPMETSTTVGRHLTDQPHQHSLGMGY